MSNDGQLRHYANKLAFEIDSWDLHEARKRGENVVVIDARSRPSFEKEHIPDSVNIPHREMTPDTTANLDRSAVIVTYCDGIGCNASTKGALAMTKLGFRVKELMGGLDWWKRDGYETVGGPGGGDCGCG